MSRTITTLTCAAFSITRSSLLVERCRAEVASEREGLHFHRAYDLGVFVHRAGIDEGQQAAIVFGIKLPGDLAFGHFAGYLGRALFKKAASGNIASILSERTVLIALVADDAILAFPFAGQRKTPLGRNASRPRAE